MKSLCKSLCPYVALLSCATVSTLFAADVPTAPEISKAKYLWSQSPHGKMLERILPRAIEPGGLPESDSEGARLAAHYCVQCHYLPNPKMHVAAKWKVIVDRMYWRMKGNGNLGQVMKEMMADVAVPTERELAMLTAYLQAHGQREIDPGHPGLKTEPGKMFSIACSQCHAPPDPGLHTAREWPAVVRRMKKHMAWANVVVGVSELRTAPELKTEEIIGFLQRYARKDSVNGEP